MADWADSAVLSHVTLLGGISIILRLGLTVGRLGFRDDGFLMVFTGMKNHG